MNALRTFLITGIGLCLLALAASVPIGCEYVGHAGPEWLRTRDTVCEPGSRGDIRHSAYNQGLVITSGLLFAALAAAGVGCLLCVVEDPANRPLKQ